MLNETSVNTAAVAAATVQLSGEAGDLQVYSLLYTFRSAHGCDLKLYLEKLCKIVIGVKI